MSRTLIIITRMYATKGSDNDEFQQIWLRNVEAQPYKLFSTGKEANADRVLVLPGYDYPLDIEQAAPLAWHAISSALEKEKIRMDTPGLRLGVTYHPRLSWTPMKQKSFGQKLQHQLEGSGARVEFIEPHRHSSIISSNLAPVCVGGENIAAEFEQIWRFFQKESVHYDERYGMILHALNRDLQRVENDLRGWQMAGYETAYGRDVIADHETGAATYLTNARRIVLGENTSELSIRALVEEIAPNLPKSARHNLLASFDNIKALFDEDEPRFQQARDFLLLLASTAVVGASLSSDHRADLVRERIEAGNPFSVWFRALTAELSRLSQSWAA